MRRLRRILAGATIALGLGVAMTGCASTTVEAPGAQQSVVKDVEFYPACGNETLTLDGVTWYSFVPEDLEAFPTPLALGNADSWPSIGTSRSMHKVVPPGPGDDTGSLVVYDGGYAYFRSDNGALTSWLTTEKIDYNFAC